MSALGSTDQGKDAASPRESRAAPHKCEVRLRTPTERNIGNSRQDLPAGEASSSTTWPARTGPLDHFLSGAWALELFVSGLLAS